MEHWTEMEQIWGGSGLPVLVLAPEAEGCATVYGNAAAQEDAPTKVKECLGKIKIASNHMMSLLNEVLIVARPQTDAGKPKFHLEIGELVRESIWADGVRLKQICLNLLSNAIKYTPAGGQVELYLSVVQAAQPDQVTMTVRITDTGIGMSKEFLGRVFQPFEREEKSTVNKIQGTVLGMAITKNLVELMGARSMWRASPARVPASPWRSPFLWRTTLWMTTRRN